MEADSQNLLGIQDKIDNVLGPGGVISRQLPSYEFRPQQLRLAKAIGKAIKDNKHLKITRF